MDPYNCKKLLSAIDQELDRIDSYLTELPDGSAYISVSAGRTRIRGTLDGRDHFFCKNELDLAKKLLCKRYLRLRTDELRHKKSMLLSVLAYERKWHGCSTSYLADHPKAASIICKELYAAGMLPQMNTDTGQRRIVDQWPADIATWVGAPDSRAAFNQVGRTEPAPGNIKVRSKSEVMIATVLCERNLPFRYEEPLVLSGHTYYPDFTIRSPLTGQFYWYEHFGMMDDPSYAQRAWDKLALYAKHSLLPSINLIVTFETSFHKLNIDKIHWALDLISL